MRRLAGTILAGLTLLMSCTGGVNRTGEYDVTVGSTTYKVEVYSDSTRTLSLDGKVLMQGLYDTVYAFDVNGRHYLGIDRKDDLMMVFDEQLKELMPAERGIRDLFFAVSDKGRRFGFINVRGDVIELMDEDFRPLSIPAADNLEMHAEIFEHSFDTPQGKVTQADTVEYVLLSMGEKAGVVDMDGRELVPMQECDDINIYRQKYYSDPTSLESHAMLSMRHSGEYGDCTAPMGFIVKKGDLMAVYGLDGTLIVPHGAKECWPVFWDDPYEARYWRATYPTTGTGTQKEGVYRRDGRCILPPMHHMGLYLMGEDKQVSGENRETHRIEAATGFKNGKFTYDYFDYEGQPLNQ
ncbi:MAG: hypothetical protein K2L96_04440 [Muribaculaceae bacterium]|nr:hypothetical protein [Muribaculaceae bacterium]